MVCWLREEERVRPGAKVVLENIPVEWTVECVGYPHETLAVQTIL